MKIQLLAGSTSQTINIFIRNSASTNGGGLTGLVFNTTSLTAYYALPKTAPVSIALVTLAAVTTAYASGGFKEIDAVNMPGWYRLDIPDASVASGRFVSVHLKGAAGMVDCPLEVELTATNNQVARQLANSDQIGGSAAAAALLSAAYAGFETGTAQAGAASSITLRAGASAVDNYYKDQAILIMSGTGAPQTNRCSSYVGSTKVVTVETAWATTPDVTSVYVIIGRIG